MSKQNTNPPFDLLRSSVCTFLTCKDIKQMNVQTENGILTFTRGADVRQDVNAIGFTADFDSDEDEDGDGYDVADVIRDYWGD